MPFAGKYPIVRGSSTINSFMEAAIRQPRPAAGVSILQWLRASGLRSSYFEDIPGLLRFLGMTDDNGPTALWDAIRSEDRRPSALLDALRTAYQEPLQFLGINTPDVTDQVRLTSHIRTTENQSAEAAASAVTTMLAAFDLALGRTTDIKRPAVATPSGGTTTPRRARTVPTGAPSRAAKEGRGRAGNRFDDPEIRIAVQVNIDPAASPEQIDAIFASMSRHLYGRPE